MTFLKNAVFRWLFVFCFAGLLPGCIDQTSPAGRPNNDGEGIKTYEDCFIAGGIILEKYPPICQIDGQGFEQDISVGKTGDKRIMRFLVEPQTVTCQGLHPVDQKCLVVNGGYFYENIEGYMHQEGAGRILKVERTQICNPDILNSCPQDIGIYRYRLLEIET